MKLALPLKWLPILKYIVIHRKNLSMYEIKKLIIDTIKSA